MRCLYFHGGPGFNSHPEKALLGASFQAHELDIRFWNEPSRLRPEGHAFTDEDTFQNSVNSAENFLLEHFDGRPITLIGHSFGAHFVELLAARHPEKVALCAFVAPALAIDHFDRSLFTVLKIDFQAHGDTTRAEKLDEILKTFTDGFDAETEAGYFLLLENPRLFEYYWFNKNRMGEFLPYYSDAGYGIDLDSFVKTRKTFATSSGGPIPVPAIAFFGKSDSFISEEIQVARLRERFPHVSILAMERSAHYPHVEETDLFLEELSAKIDGAHAAFFTPTLS